MKRTVTCDSCGVEGEEGDHPGEGKIVRNGGESYGGRLDPTGRSCDDCADEAAAKEAASRATAANGGRP